MAFGQENRWSVRGATPAVTDVGVDVGLRQYMLRVYNYMASGLALTGIVAWAAANYGDYQAIQGSPVMWLVILAPLGLVFVLSYGIDRMSAGTAQALFWVYAGLLG